MSQQERSSRMAVLLFTDMVNSVALERRLGTATYSGLLQLHHQLFMQVLEQVPGGQVRNDFGDGIMSEFDTAAGAVNAALLFQMLLRETKWEKEAPSVRIGIHQGQLAEIRLDPASPGKLVGMPVNLASRVMNLAQGGQILMTRPVYDDARQFVREHPSARGDASAPPAVQWKAHGAYVFKGSEDPMEIFEVGTAGFAPLTAPAHSEKSSGTVVLAHGTASKWSPAIGAALAVLWGLLLWAKVFGDAWENASYDYLFLFATRAVPDTNKVVLILMDNLSYEDKELHQQRSQPWNRALHAKLLNQLAQNGCKLVVFDAHFDRERNADEDADLAKAMRRQTNVVLMAVVHDSRARNLTLDQVVPPDPIFANASSNWGIANAGVELLETPRRHWPFPSPINYPSLPWAAALAAGAELSEQPEERWLRYYGETESWDALSYCLVPTNVSSYFRGKIVFIGSDPEAIRDPRHREEDKFCTPYTRWTKNAVGGVQIMATTFLNLMNGDWLRRPAGWLEVLILVVMGSVLGAGLCLVRSWLAWLIAAGAFLAVTVAGVCLSYYTNYWFPWLVIAGGQAPCALAWALYSVGRRREIPAAAQTPEPAKAPATTATAVPSMPEAPDYQLFNPPFGEGGFGKVWLARNAIGQWQALKAVYRSKFGPATGPYDAEFKGIQKYKPVSSKHPGLLGVDFVSKQKPEGYSYSVMELGDSRVPGWQENPALYKPRDLASVCAAAEDRRLPAATCARIAAPLADALDFLHRQGLTHRDIKPSNVIFVNEQPRLADVGLMTDIRSPSQIQTWAGTAGFMPPDDKEPPGTVQADIYALGMLLYVISTGREPGLFPVLPTALVQPGAQADFMRLNAIIRKACHPELAQRYSTAAEMRDALLEAQQAFTAQPFDGQAPIPG